MAAVSSGALPKGQFAEDAASGLETSEKPAPAWRDEFLAAGYKPYHDSFKARGEEHVPDDRRMYVGSVQKRVRDARGTRYFLNVDLYDFTMHQGGRRSASANVQFQMSDEDWGGCANVERSVEGSVAETEAWFWDLWHRMGWGYYEINDASMPAANKATPTPACFRTEGVRMEDDVLIMELRGLARVLDTDSSPSGAEAVRQAVAEIKRLRAEEARLKGEFVRRGNRTCPFPGADLKPEEACPVCGDLGTWDAENLARESNCVERPLPRSEGA
ncbi:hypothetical protein GCM10025880_01260 [Methylorubrum aminovorans]|nr:hypothetical protein [Methylorubrum aminovorans]GMA73709.1 hypothetical protein GCM10025880_01260 [Methylorubrum aminovorans]